MQISLGVIVGPRYSASSCKRLGGTMPLFGAATASNHQSEGEWQKKVVD